jgi:AcrR family transcriptional regulator
MFTGMKKRPYTLKKRADSKDVTRARIVAATVELHEKLGPKNTTISAVAERAGVQRLTVYRHFPDETALFTACTSQWLEDNPPPDPAAWRDIADASERLSAALTAFYSYYRRTERMWAAAHRDENEVRALRAPMKKFRGYLDAVADELAGGLVAGLTKGQSGRIALTLRHAVQFETWRSLSSQGAGDAALVALVVEWISAIRRDAP